MTETQIIKKIKKLKAIKPRSDWVLLNKRQILGEERRIELFPFLRPVYAGLFCLLFLAGLFEFSQESLPGDSLYYLKKITEKSQIIFSSEEEKPRIKLELVNKRLEELDQIVQENEARKLAPALKEYHAIASEAFESLERAMTTTSDPVVIKEIAEQTQKFEENKEKLTKIYGIAGLESDEESNPTKIVVEWLIRDMEETTLSEEDGLLFGEAKEDYEQGNYSQALVKILDLSQK